MPGYGCRQPGPSFSPALHSLPSRQEGDLSQVFCPRICPQMSWPVFLKLCPDASGSGCPFSAFHTSSPPVASVRGSEEVTSGGAEQELTLASAGSPSRLSTSTRGNCQARKPRWPPCHLESHPKAMGQTSDCHKHLPHSSALASEEKEYLTKSHSGHHT